MVCRLAIKLVLLIRIVHFIELFFNLLVLLEHVLELELRAALHFVVLVDQEGPDVPIVEAVELVQAAFLLTLHVFNFIVRASLEGRKVRMLELTVMGSTRVIVGCRGRLLGSGLEALHIRVLELGVMSRACIVVGWRHRFGVRLFGFLSARTMVAQELFLESPVLSVVVE